VVTVQVKADSTPSGTFQIQKQANGSVSLSFDGVPGKSYRIQWTASLANPNWQTLSTNTADMFGSYQLIDTPPINSPARYYRSITP
jgi:hypothetical protein